MSEVGGLGAQPPRSHRVFNVLNLIMSILTIELYFIWSLIKIFSDKSLNTVQCKIGNINLEEKCHICNFT